MRGGCTDHSGGDPLVEDELHAVTGHFLARDEDHGRREQVALLAPALGREVVHHASRHGPAWAGRVCAIEEAVSFVYGSWWVGGVGFVGSLTTRTVAASRTGQ